MCVWGGGGGGGGGAIADAWVGGRAGYDGAARGGGGGAVERGRCVQEEWECSPKTCCSPPLCCRDVESWVGGEWEGLLTPIASAAGEV